MSDARPDEPQKDPLSSTISKESEVDEASYESFPASDSPGYAGGSVTPSQYEGDAPEEAPANGDPDNER